MARLLAPRGMGLSDCRVGRAEAGEPDGHGPRRGRGMGGRRAVRERIWPPNHRMVPVTIAGVTDPDNDGVAITITGVTQDEPVNGLGDGDTSPDAVLQGSSALIRAERSGTGNGRVYEVRFSADDSLGGSCAGAVRVTVPHSMKPGTVAVDDGQVYTSTMP